MQTILSINNLTKSYGPVQALKNVSFEVPEGCVFGILGPNGSGKTTLLGTILNVLNADAGSFQWFGGMQQDAARRQIGSLLETPNFYHYLSAMGNLEVNAAIKQRGKDDKLRVLEKMGLLQRKDSKFQTYSLGMKQRLAIAAALLGNPKVLVFDEPTNGLDPAGIAEVREMIRMLNKEGITIIMASHLLDEVEKVCTHVAILKKGDLLLSGPVDEVLRSEDQVEVKAADMQLLEGVLATMPGITKVQVANDLIQVTCSENVTTQGINEYCVSKGIILSHLLLKKKSLETKFMELTNN
ncbi:MAG: ATP-binding cassette domain-containing protein [Bacteroidetes bacterium]|nr:ATP-binding cassette domain-containing protein [Bacteroidota bacterium]